MPISQLEQSLLVLADYTMYWHNLWISLCIWTQVGVSTRPSRSWVCSQSEAHRICILGFIMSALGQSNIENRPWRRNPQNKQKNKTKQKTKTDGSVLSPTDMVSFHLWVKKSLRLPEVTTCQSRTHRWLSPPIGNNSNIAWMWTHHSMHSAKKRKQR